MGRKRRLPARAREKVVVEELASAMEVEQKDSLLKAKPDDSLFVVDAAGSGRKRRKMQKQAKAEKYVSKNEKKLIVHKFLGKGSVPQVVKSPKRITDPWADDEQSQGSSSKSASALTSGGEGDASEVPENSKTAGAGGAGNSAMVSGVGERANEFLVAPRKPGQSKRPKPSSKDLAKLPVCHPGQSYNPTEDDHDDVLATAVAVELRRQEAIDEEALPVSRGMSKETLALLVGDEEGESSDEEEDGAGEASLGKPTPATGKLTRAQRNKQKRAKQAARQLSVRRRKKDMLKSIDKITVLQQELADQEVLRRQRRQTKRVLKEQKARSDEDGGGLLGRSSGIADLSTSYPSNKAVIASRSVPVNLGEELHGSLRKLKAQGSVLMDKVELLKACKAHPDRRLGKERAKKAPKGFRKKHTYKDRYKDD